MIKNCEMLDIKVILEAIYSIPALVIFLTVPVIAWAFLKINILIRINSLIIYYYKIVSLLIISLHLLIVLLSLGGGTSRSVLGILTLSFYSFMYLIPYILLASLPLFLVILFLRGRNKQACELDNPAPVQEKSNTQPQN